MRRTTVFILFACVLWTAPNARAEGGGERVEFNRDIRPILSDTCFFCHGPDANQRKAGLRLDLEESAKAAIEGVFPIIPGDAAKSEIIRRMRTDDPDDKMPPPDSHRKVTPKQIETIKKWIEQGAVWQQHWAFIAPKRPQVPAVAGVVNPIDGFIFSRLAKEKLKPSPQAERETLIRRVTLDLTGLPPTAREVDDFVNDKSPDAYEKVVDRLLRSPHYGERMALPWLDAARYADSNGFQQDGDTYQYVWRDWVVKAMNENMPFDRFTFEQLAGDLLPNATDEQKIATAFNRNHLLNGEGGAIPDEQRFVNLFDRVDVTATTWLGLTMACAQCHDHKYDPLTQKDYYRLMAFFNNVPEAGVPQLNLGNYRLDQTWIYAPDEQQKVKLAELEKALAGAKAHAAAVSAAPEVAAAQTAWEAAAGGGAPVNVRPDAWHSIGPFGGVGFSEAYQNAFPPEKEVALEKTYGDGKLKWTARPELTDGKVHNWGDENSAVYLYRVIHADRDTPAVLSLGSDDSIKAWVNGSPVLSERVMRAAMPDQHKVKVALRAGENKVLLKIVNGGGIGGFYFNLSVGSLPADIAALLATDAAKRTPEAAAKLREYFLANHAPAGVTEARAAEQRRAKELEDFRNALPRVMVMSDASPRKTMRLDRGIYTMPKEEVKPGVPEVFVPLPEGAPQNRLGFAQWLVSEENPLMSRVQVNRYWQHFFGKGLVKTPENLGIQSETPVHGELLDWLAVEFRESGWDVKRMHKLIVTSATYRQSSRVTPLLRERDPENLYYARGARFRMPSLILRDVALAAGGLLDTRMGGKPVYPYQPKDIWDGLAITKERDFTYPQSTGKDLYRRSLYTFWRRTVAPGNMFDAPSRQACTVRASITSTPLHALTTLNDVTWVEAARALAQRVMQEGGADVDARLAEAFRRVCARKPAAEDLKLLRRSYDRALAAFRADTSAAAAFLKAGESARDETLDVAEHAAYASVCLAIFNLDEALTRE